MSGSPTPGPVLAFLTALGLHSLCALTSDPQAHPLLASQQPSPGPAFAPGWSLTGSLALLAVRRPLSPAAERRGPCPS